MNLERMELALMRKASTRLRDLNRKYNANYTRLYQLETDLKRFGLPVSPELTARCTHFRLLSTLTLNILSRRADPSVRLAHTPALYGRFGRDEVIPTQFLFYAGSEWRKTKWAELRAAYCHLHACCPACGGQNFTTQAETYSYGGMGEEKELQNLNLATCLTCGDQHVVHERVPD
jgi:hypothetical protein